MNCKICILDYGSGNVKSVFNMVRLLDSSVIISNEPKDISAATHLILPGVGAFQAAMEAITANIDLAVLKQAVFEQKKKLLGICVGMQVLADTGYEFGEHPGLGWIPGSVKKIDAPELPLPHVGWNTCSLTQQSKLTKTLTADFDFYFVHSYAFSTTQQEYVLATTTYGQEFPSIIGKDTVYGVQFHPEKSQRAGEVLIKNFLSL